MLMSVRVCLCFLLCRYFPFHFSFFVFNAKTMIITKFVHLFWLLFGFSKQTMSVSTKYTEFWVLVPFIDCVWFHKHSISCFWMISALPRWLLPWIYLLPFILKTLQTFWWIENAFDTFLSIRWKDPSVLCTSCMRFYDSNRWPNSK